MWKSCAHEWRSGRLASCFSRWVVLSAVLAFGASAVAQNPEKRGDDKRASLAISDAELDEFEAKLKYSEPEKAGLVIFGLIAEQGRDRVEALLRAGQTRRPAGLWGTQWQMMFAQDRLEGNSLTGEARKEHFRKALAYLQESYDATTHALQQARGEQDTEEKHPSEHAPVLQKAYASFLIALKNMPNPPRTDRDVYNWLADNPAKIDDYELPDYQTWLRGPRNVRNEMLRSMIPNLQECLALAALEAGETATAKRQAGETATAKRQARELLKNNTDSKSWNYGNIIHNANEILGRLALREGKVAEAKRYLLKAGQTPGSPQLNSYGPSMDLAKELSVQGEREAVLAYFYLCSKFWKNDRGPYYGGRLNEWSRTILEDRIPDFGRKSKGASATVQRQMTRDAGDGESVKQGKLVLRHPNGQKLGEGAFENGKPHGKFTTWYENGQKWLEWECQEGKRRGKWTDWHENGQKWAEGQYLDGKRHGDTTYWHEDGQKWAKGQYQHGEKRGPWHVWDEHGARTYSPSRKGPS